MENKQAKKVLSAALATGADLAELYVQNKLSRVVQLNYKRVDNVATTLVYGAGLRLMRGVQQVYGYTSDLSEASLLALADKLAAYFDGKRAVDCGDIKDVKNPETHKPKKEHETLSVADTITYLKKGEDAIYAASPLIVNATCNAIFNDEKAEIFTATADGARAVRDRRVHTRLTAQAVAARDGAFEVGFSGPGLSKGAEFLDEIDYVAEAEKAAKTAVALLDAPECPSGVMPVVIGNGFGGVLFHEACGHPLEGTAISHNASPFAGKLGEKVASELVTAIDDGTRKNGWGSECFDDEGVASTKNVLIEKGVLKSYMVDTFDGRRLGMKPTGACRRESYKFQIGRAHV